MRRWGEAAGESCATRRGVVRRAQRVEQRMARTGAIFAKEGILAFHCWFFFFFYNGMVTAARSLGRGAREP
jgi:hypothetical protein